MSNVFPHKIDVTKAPWNFHEFQGKSNFDVEMLFCPLARKKSGNKTFYKCLDVKEHNLGCWSCKYATEVTSTHPHPEEYYNFEEYYEQWKSEMLFEKQLDNLKNIDFDSTNRMTEVLIKCATRQRKHNCIGEKCDKCAWCLSEENTAEFLINVQKLLKVQESINSVIEKYKEAFEY